MEENDKEAVPEPRSTVAFTLSIVALCGACLFAGAMVSRWVLARRARRAAAQAGVDPIALIAHASVDIELGRGAAVVDLLGREADKEKDVTLKKRLLALWEQAALQAARPDLAERANLGLEALAQNAGEKRRVEMRRIAELGAEGRRADAEALAAQIIHAAADDPAAADEARWRLMAATYPVEVLDKHCQELKPSASPTADEIEAERRCGVAELEVASNPQEAARLLAAVLNAGQRDASLFRALLAAYSSIGDPKSVAVLAEAVAAGMQPGPERDRLELVRAKAQADSGDAQGALATVELVLKTAVSFDVRESARRTRYQLLQKVGKLDAEVAALEQKGDVPARAFIALQVEKDYALAVKLYGDLAKASPDSMEYDARLRDAEQAKDLADRRALYEQVLAKDPQDQATREKLLQVDVRLGDTDASVKVARDWLGGRDKDPQALVALARLFLQANDSNDAAQTLHRAYSLEADPAAKQQILVLLGDTYAAGQHPDEARRVYSSLAAEGISPEVREEAVDRLAGLTQPAAP